MRTPGCQDGHIRDIGIIWGDAWPNFKGRMLSPLVTASNLFYYLVHCAADKWCAVIIS